MSRLVLSAQLRPYLDLGRVYTPAYSEYDIEPHKYGLKKVSLSGRFIVDLVAGPMMTVAKTELPEEEEDEEEINVEEEDEDEEAEERVDMAEDLRASNCSSSNLPQNSDNYDLAASQRRKQRR